jgi:predicted  nucleic acid-binding Zn-ribbon protein
VDIAKIREYCEELESIDETLEELNTDLLATSDEVAELKKEIEEQLALQNTAMENLKKECGIP